MFPWLMENLHAGNVVHIADVSKMPPDAALEKKEFEKEGIKAILILPVYNILLLFYGFVFGQFHFFWKFEKRMLSRMLNRKKRVA